MSGSAAEERIRAKAEAYLRSAFPAARIIHELVLAQGGCRADLAAVTADRLICIEIKSERDVLTRLPGQIEAMRQVCDAWCVVTAEKHLEKCREIAGWLHTCSEDRLDGADLWRRSMGGLTNAPARLEMLWAAELRWIAGCRGARRACIQAATDSMTGAQVRRAVCSALRERAFPRADSPIPSIPEGRDG